MKNKPIIFQDWQVKAWHDGRLSKIVFPVKKATYVSSRVERNKYRERGYFETYSEIFALSPYQIGDVLYVRERFAYYPASLPSEKMIVYWPGENQYPDWPDRRGAIKENCVWRSPVTMPIWAARTYFRVTGVECMRIDNIVLPEIQKLGIEGVDISHTLPKSAEGTFDYGNPFKWHWNNRYAKKGYGYDLNPYVWVFDIEECEVVGD